MAAAGVASVLATAAAVFPDQDPYFHVADAAAASEGGSLREVGLLVAACQSHSLNCGPFKIKTVCHRDKLKGPRA